MVAISLAAAVSFGWSTAAMHHSASAAPASVGGPAALLRHLARRWVWLTGLAASLLGLSLHALALRLGSLSVVQPVVVTGLIFSLVFGDLLHRRWSARTGAAWAVLTVCGLALFLGAARSTTGAVVASGSAAVAVLTVGVAAAVGCWWTASRLTGRARGVMLGAGAGINFGLTAGTLKATTAASTPLALVASWPVYVLVTLGLSGFVANQVAYRSAPLSASLPILNVLNPVVAVLYGFLVFRERPASDALTYGVECLGLVLALLGVFRLAKLETSASEAR